MCTLLKDPLFSNLKKRKFHEPMFTLKHKFPLLKPIRANITRENQGLNDITYNRREYI